MEILDAIQNLVAVIASILLDIATFFREAADAVFSVLY